MPAQSATFAVLSCTAATTDELPVDAADCSRLLELLGLVPDPRKRRGVRHSVAAILAIAAAAVLAGSRSILAIAEWATEAPQVVLAGLGARYNPVSGGFSAPHVDTFRRVLRPVDAAAVDTAIGLFLAERIGMGGSGAAPGGAGAPSQDGHDNEGRHSHDRQPDPQPRPEQNTPATRGLSVDGKTLRGASQPDGRAIHLLAAMTHDGSAVLAQRDVAHKRMRLRRSSHSSTRLSSPGGR